jgi:multidrug efflux system membrane fusion protein
MNRFFLKIFIAKFITIFLIYGCGNDDHEYQKDLYVPVKIAPIIKKDLSFPIRTSGILSAPSEMKLSFKIGGIVKEIHVDEGDIVKKDQVLSKLDQSEIGAQVNQAKSAFENAKLDLKRVNNLYADSAVTLEQKQDAETGFEIAKANLSIAKFNYQHSVIKAPSKGIILKRFVEQNEMVNTGMPIFIVGSTEKSWLIRAGISDKDVITLRLGDSASISFDAYSDISFPAVVSQIAESADPMTGTFEVELTLEQTEYKLISGFIGSIEIFPSNKKNYRLIPIEALVEADNNHGNVFVLNDSGKTAKKIQIKWKYILKDKIVVTGGLEDETVVITDGSSYLSEGAMVQVISED